MTNSKDTMSVLEAWGKIHPIERPIDAEVRSVSLERAQMTPRDRIWRTNPVTRPEPGLIKRETPVGSMGSCFSTRIHDWLVEHGYNYVCTEPEPRELDESMFIGGWIQHTARFGHVYNTACALQILARAIGRFSPVEDVWGDQYHGKEILRDPYRAGVAWSDRDDMQSELHAHCAAVREAVEQCEVFIVTAGLAEVWRSKIDGSTFATSPHTNVHDPDRHEFVLTSVEENVENLECMYRMMREINPDIRLVLALSPMRLKATYRPVHWAVGNSVSKSVLRVAIDQFCTTHPEVIYFPSYEIVTGMLTEDAYEPDALHLQFKHVERVMTSFMSAYGEPSEVEAALGSRTVEQAMSVSRGKRDEHAEEALAAHHLIDCVTGETLAAKLYFRSVWQRLGAVYGDRPIVIIGGGLHTRRLAAAVEGIEGPNVLAILDDVPSDERIGHWECKQFSAVDPGSVAGALVSTDTIIDVLAQRARDWIGSAATSIELVYDTQQAEFSTA